MTDAIPSTDYVLLRTSSSTSKGNIEVAVVACVREPCQALTVAEAKTCTQIYTIRLYQFLDDERFSLLDALLLQLGPDAVHLSETMQCQKHLLGIFDTQHIYPHYLSKSHTSSNHDESVLAFLRGKTLSESEVLIVERDRRTCLSLLSTLFDLQSWRHTSSFPPQTKLHLLCDSPLQCMCLDSAAAEAVNLLPQPGQPQVGSLFGLFARYLKTKLGLKTLERWLRQPLLEVAAIEKRLDVVQALLEQPLLRSQLRDNCLKSVPDVRPSLAKLQRGSGGLPELFKLYLFSRAISSIATALTEETQRTQSNNQIHQSLEIQFVGVFVQLKTALEMYEGLIEHVLDLSQLPELRVSPTHDPDLQLLEEEETNILAEAETHVTHLRHTLSKSRDTQHLSDAIRLETGHSATQGLVFRCLRTEDERLLRELSLPILNSTNSNKKEKVKILSILKNGIIFVTDTLCTLGDRLLQTKQDYDAKQSEVVNACVTTAATYLPVFDTAATQVSQLDVLQAFSVQAAEAAGDYSRPVLLPLITTTSDENNNSNSNNNNNNSNNNNNTNDDSNTNTVTTSATTSSLRRPVFEVSQGRHPCVELVCATRFVPNDYQLCPQNVKNGNNQHQHKSQYTNTDNVGDGEEAVVIVVTGPNTGGKSTYIRTAAVLTVLAQIGSFVPCRSMRVSVTDRLFCRVGAGDLQQKHISTFLLEMLETQRMLANATLNSLLVIDELGRGTSTADGFGLAVAIARHIATHESLKCRCLFATHFHELTQLSVCHNLHVSAAVITKNATNNANNTNNDEHIANNMTNNTSTNTATKSNMEEVVMRYEVKQGACQQSFGVHVAAMTDFPVPVLHEAKRKLHALETTYNANTNNLANNKYSNTSNDNESIDISTDAGATQRYKRLKSVATNFSQLHDTLQHYHHTNNNGGEEEKATQKRQQFPREMRRQFPRSLLL